MPINPKYKYSKYTAHIPQLLHGKCDPMWPCQGQPAARQPATLSFSFAHSLAQTSITSITTPLLICVQQPVLTKTEALLV